jgi:hypothetical protein
MRMVKQQMLMVAALLSAGPAWAEDSGAGSTLPPAAATIAAATGFQALSSDDQHVARALFLAQHPTMSGPAALDLNQIAGLRGDGGWNDAFREMASAGLIEEKSLHQVIAGYERRPHAIVAASIGGTFVVTKGTGRTSVAGTELSRPAAVAQ